MAYPPRAVASAGGIWLGNLHPHQQRFAQPAPARKLEEEDALIGAGGRLALLALVLVIGLGIWSPAEAERGGAQAAAGFVISPIYQNVSLEVQQPRTHYIVSLNNTTESSQAFKLSTVDFGSLNDSAGVAFLGATTSSFARTYGLSKWMKLDQDTVTVPAGKSVDIRVTIENADTLATGGHYGAVLATALTAPNDLAVQPRVGVFEVLSSLVLLIKQGHVRVGLDLAAQTHDGNWLALPSQVTDQFRNSGNVHVVPRGVVEVRDPFGRVVKRGSINENSGTILPENTRTYVTPLMKLAGAGWPGIYTLKLIYRYDGGTSERSFSSACWYLGRTGLVVIGVVLLLGAGAGFAWWRLGRRRRLRGKA